MNDEEVDTRAEGDPMYDRAAATDADASVAGNDQNLSPAAPADQGYDGRGRRPDFWPEHANDFNNDTRMWKTDREVALDVALYTLNAKENPGHFQIRDRAQADLEYYNSLSPEAKKLVDDCMAEIKADTSHHSYAQISEELKER